MPKSIKNKENFPEVGSKMETSKVKPTRSRQSETCPKSSVSKQSLPKDGNTK